jgi:CRISPR-associated endonuclease/helicase Cas3
MPESVFLDRHLHDVVVCAKAIASSTQDHQLSCFGLNPDIYRERFGKILLISAACHDLGKANSHFQAMLSLKRTNPTVTQRQAVRHEWITWFLLCQMEMASWIQGKLDNEFAEVDWHLILWSITGHHPAYGRSIPHERSHGSRDEVEVFLSHPDYRNCLNIVAETIGETQCPINLASRTYSAESDILSAIRDSYADSVTRWRKWRKDPSIVGLLAAAKNSLVAADVAGSAIPIPREDSRSDLDSWHGTIVDKLSQTPSGRDLDTLISDRLPQDGKRYGLRPFQTRVADEASDVTLVTAGCGSGKTLAAYHWARVHCPGKRLYMCYPTTGTATEGFRDYLFDHDDHQPKFGAALFHGRSRIDQRVILGTLEDESDEYDSFARIRSLQSWGASIVSCTVDTVLGIIHNHRRAIYSWPSICNAALVFDEIHSYDDSLFGALLAMLKNMPGIPVLLMTASLPANRLELLRSTLKNRGRRLSEVEGPEELESLKRYTLELCSDDRIVKRVQDELSRNGKILWVSNTVNRTIAAYRRCSGLCGSNTVYHSRYRYLDRINRHKEVIEQFKTPGATIAWTSQVAEMSLDLSATLLITDLAPIPAMIQRLGRLNRRALRLGDPIHSFIVLEPTSDDGKMFSLPYTAGQLNEARDWLAKLPSAISQKDLVFAWESMNSNDKRIIDSSSYWIDGGFERNVKEIRDANPGVNVIRSVDVDDVIQGRRSILEVAIPMNQPNGITVSTRKHVQGTMVVDENELWYSETLGAEWR